MCGIAGILPLGDTKRTDDLEPKLVAMCNALRHRGPDDSGIYQTDSIALGHRRLAIIDLSQAAHQPMIDGKDALVFNGEIYNYKELAKKYELGEAHSDTRVLLQLLKRIGKKILSELRGFFTFAFWNGKERTLLIARGPFGKKPLYYSQTNSRFIFSSELRSLSKGLENISLSQEGLSLYLSYYSIPAPYSIIEGVRQLPAGCYLEITKDGKTHLEQWWRLPSYEPLDLPRREIVKKLRGLLEESIQYRLVSDVPVGAFLSGGLDSNVIVGLMSKLVSTPISTFTIDFESSSNSYSEITYARAGARAFHSDHHERLFSGKEVFSLLPGYFNSLDSPSGDAINSYLVALAAKEACPELKVVLSGVGSDELLLGYRKYRLLGRLANVRSVVELLPTGAKKTFVHTIQSLKKEKLSSLVTLFLDPLSIRILFNQKEQAELLHSNAKDASLLIDQIQKHMAFNKEDTLMTLQRSDLEQYLPSMLLRDLDNMTMAFSLEGRAPFLDHKLAEFCWQIPVKEKAKGVTKSLLIEACQEFLPKEIQHKNKSGFELPIKNWLLHGPFKPLLEELKSGRLAMIESGYLQKKGVRELAIRFESGHMHYLRVWSIIVLEHWYRSFLGSDFLANLV